ncbi:MAG TPA: hypothetical protein VI336_03945 [Candidatus Saccharimonadales bacterium]|nr:hypothetical protein [Candidatus Saccharimonadales bacterium]
MSKEKASKRYINENGALITLPREQGTIDELKAEIQEHSRTIGSTEIPRAAGMLAVADVQSESNVT